MRPLLAFLFSLWVFLGVAAVAAPINTAVINMPPYTSDEYLDDYGVFTEIVNAVHQETGLTAQRKIVPAKRAMVSLMRERFDAAYPFVKMPEIEKDYLWSDPVLKLRGYFFYNKEQTQPFAFETLQDLKGKKIGGVLGSFYEELFKREKIAIDMKKSEEIVINLLSKGRIELAPMDLSAGWGFIRKYDIENFYKYDTVGKGFLFEDLYLIAPTSKTEYIKQFNTGLATIKQNGVFDKILKKYNVSLNTKQKGEPTKVCLALNGGLGDQGFNDMQYSGLIEAKNHYNIQVAFTKPDKERNNKKMIEELVSKESCALTISAGFDTLESLTAAAKAHPDKAFAHIDTGKTDLPTNLTGTNFSQHEGSYAAGVLAALSSQSKKIGFIGGVDIPVVKAFALGFEEGIKATDPKATLEVRYVSAFPDFSGFNSADKGKQMAESMYQSGIDIVYAVAGGTGMGVIEAAKSTGNYAIGVDSDQDHFAKGHVLTSMIKRVDVAVFDLVKRFMEKGLKGGEFIQYGYQNGGVSLSDFTYTKDKIGAEILDQVKAVEQQISEKKITVTDVMAGQ